MDAPLLSSDFKEFLRLLNAHGVDCLLVGGYVEFVPCRTRALVCDLDGVPVPVIALADLKANKRAAGRNKDLADLDNLP